MKVTIENVKRANRTFEELSIGEYFVFASVPNDLRVKTGGNGEKSLFYGGDVTYCRSDAAVRRVLELKLVLEE